MHFLWSVQSWLHYEMCFIKFPWHGEIFTDCSFYSSIPQFNPNYYLDSHTFWPDLYWSDGQLRPWILLPYDYYVGLTVVNLPASQDFRQTSWIQVLKLRSLSQTTSIFAFKSGFINLRIIYFMQDNYCQLKIRPYKRTQKEWSLQ